MRQSVDQVKGGECISQKNGGIFTKDEQATGLNPGILVERILEEPLETNT